MFSNNSTVINAENIWWGASDGPLDASNDGRCPINNGSGNAVSDTATQLVDYCPYSSSKLNSASVTTQATTDVQDITATANGTLTSIDSFFAIEQHGHVWSTLPDPAYVEPRAHWRMNDNAGNSSVADVYGLYNGTYHGTGGSDDYTSAHSVAGKINTALEFDGTQDYIDLEDGAFTSFKAGFTVAFWVNPTAVKVNSRFFDFGNGTSSENIRLNRIESGSNMVFSVLVGSAAYNLTATGAITPNIWQHYAVTVDTSGKTVIYVNGSPHTSGTTAIPKEISRTNNYIAKSNGAEAFFQGYIDDFRIFGTALTPTQITSIYNSNLGTEASISTSQSELGATETLGPYNTPMVSLTQETTYYVRSYVKTSEGYVSYGSQDSFTTLHTNIIPVATVSNLSGQDNIYAGKTLTISSVYSDADGASDLDKLYLKITNPSATDIEYYAQGGGDATGLTPIHISGNDYVTSITYDRDTGSPDSNSITITWYISFDWDWVESTDIEYGVKAVDVSLGASDWDYTNNNYLYENDLTFVGTLSAVGQINGTLTSGDWVQGGEQITWGGLIVVYQGTLNIYPSDDHFDIRVADNGTGEWFDTTSSGEAFSVQSTADSMTDLSDEHTITIVNIPSGGSDISSQSFTVRVDANLVDIIDVTGANENTWQSADSGPIISWTDPASPSGDVFYITNDGTDPTDTSYTYSTLNTTYDLPQQGEGERSIKVRGINSVKKLGPVYEFIIKYDNTNPIIDSLLSSSHSNPAEWYANNTPAVSWETTDTVSGVESTWRLLDQIPTHDTAYIISNGTADSEDGSHTSGILADGVWYFHLAVRDIAGLSTSSTFRFQIDTSIPDIVDITGDYEDIWQNVTSAPVINWTLPASLSGDTFYLTNDGSLPTNTNYTYTTATNTYDLPAQGQGETVIKVRPQNGAGTYGDTYSFVLRYDSLPPSNISQFVLTAVSSTRIDLSWQNSPESDFSYVVLVRKLDSLPSSPTDGTVIYTGNSSTFSNTDLSANTKYYYGIFAFDTLDNVSSGTLGSVTTPSASASPPTPPPSSLPTPSQPENDNELPQEMDEISENAEPIPQLEAKMEIYIDGIASTDISSKPVRSLAGSTIRVVVPSVILQKEDTGIIGVYLLIGDQVYQMVYDPTCECFQCRVLGPNMKGAYTIRVLASYEDGSASTLSTDLAVDPYGYVYTQNGQNQLRVSGAKVYLYQKDGDLETLWSSELGIEYDNPQITDAAGEYSFIVSNGTYRLVVKADGFYTEDTGWFDVDDIVINMNIKLRPISDWWILLGIAGALLTASLGLQYYKYMNSEKFSTKKTSKNKQKAVTRTKLP